MPRNPESKNSNFIYQGFLAFLIFLSLYGCGPLSPTDTSSNVPIMQSEGEPTQLGKNLTLMVDPSLHLQVKTNKEQLNLLLDYLNDGNEYRFQILPKGNKENDLSLSFPKKTNTNLGNIIVITVYDGRNNRKDFSDYLIAGAITGQKMSKTNNTKITPQELKKSFQQNLKNLQDGNDTTGRPDLFELIYLKSD